MSGAPWATGGWVSRLRGGEWILVHLRGGPHDGHHAHARRRDTTLVVGGPTGPVYVRTGQRETSHGCSLPVFAAATARRPWRSWSPRPSTWMSPWGTQVGAHLSGGPHDGEHVVVMAGEPGIRIASQANVVYWRTLRRDRHHGCGLRIYRASRLNNRWLAAVAIGRRRRHPPW